MLHERLADLNKAEGEEKTARAKGALLASANILGLLADDPRHWLEGNISLAPSGISQAIEFRARTAVRGREWIERRIEERDAARRQRDFPTADRIRADLAAVGVILEDTPQGTTWRRA
jgi:cysteinyl-tRNA synthetase